VFFSTGLFVTDMSVVGWGQWILSSDKGDRLVGVSPLVALCSFRWLYSFFMLPSAQLALGCGAIVLLFRLACGASIASLGCLIFTCVSVLPL
jgi:hypothetical protein